MEVTDQSVFNAQVSSFKERFPPEVQESLRNIALLSLQLAEGELIEGVEELPNRISALAKLYAQGDTEQEVKIAESIQSICDFAKSLGALDIVTKHYREVIKDFGYEENETSEAPRIEPNSNPEGNTE